MQLSEIAYFSDDVEAMTDFFQELLGSEPVVQSEEMAIFVTGETKLFIHLNYTPGKGEMPPENHVAFTVEDVDTKCNELQSQGMVIERGPRTYYWGRSAYLRAPDGQLVELIQAEKEEE